MVNLAMASGQASRSDEGGSGTLSLCLNLRTFLHRRRIAAESGRPRQSLRDPHDKGAIGALTRRSTAGSGRPPCNVN
jgi:hypothetical protein